jgi:response regulator RpfG family c-di-GMP phosphodiesterase
MIHGGKAGAPGILVVDDEVSVLMSVVDLLRKEYDVYATDNADEALALLENENIALVLTDQRMPKMLGYELLSRAAKICPDTVRVLFTAYSNIEAVIQSVNEGRIFKYL